MEEYLFKNYTYKIIGAAMEVHSELGCGFLEAVYQEALALEFDVQKIPYVQEQKLEIEYKGHVLEKYYKADFICYDDIIVEIKALSELTSEHEAQILNYLKATNKKIGLLINFGQKSLKYKRFIFSEHS